MRWQLPSLPPRGRWRWVAAVGLAAVLITAAGVGVDAGARASVRTLVVTGWRLPAGGETPTSATTALDDSAFADADASEPVPPPTLHWTPSPTATWQWLPAGTPSLSSGTTGSIDVYDLPLATTTADTVAAVHASGAHAVCWISVGIVSTTSPYADDVAPQLLGQPVPGHADEHYLDIRHRAALKDYVAGQLDDCWTKGFDGVDAAAMDTAFNPGPDGVGFPVTSADQQALARMVAGLAHARGLAVGLHSGPADGDGERDRFVTAVEPLTDFAVVERCIAAGPGCGAFSPYPRHGKAVFHLEYLGDYPGATTAAPQSMLVRVCPAARQLGFSSIVKDGDGTAPDWRAPCI